MKERRARRSAVCHQASAPRSASRAAPAVAVAEVEVAVLIGASYPGAESAFPFSSADTAIHSPLQPPSPFEPARAATRRGQLSSPIVCDCRSHHTPFAPPHAGEFSTMGSGLFPVSAGRLRPISQKVAETAISQHFRTPARTRKLRWRRPRFLPRVTVLRAIPAESHPHHSRRPRAVHTRRRSCRHPHRG